MWRGGEGRGGLRGGWRGGRKRDGGGVERGGVRGMEGVWRGGLKRVHTTRTPHLDGKGSGKGG